MPVSVQGPIKTWFPALVYIPTRPRGIFSRGAIITILSQTQLNKYDEPHCFNNDLASRTWTTGQQKSHHSTSPTRRYTDFHSSASGIDQYE